MPYKALDLDNNGTFKIQFAANIDAFNTEMRDYYPNGYYITNYLLSDQITSTVLDLMKRFIPARYQNNKDDIWIQCTQSFMNELFRDVCKELKSHYTYKEFGLTGRNERNYKLFKVDKRETPEFGGLVVYHT
jgi:hypothetical protein